MDTQSDKPDSTKLTVSFKYYRVFPSPDLPRKGEPPTLHLYSYQRGNEDWSPYERGGMTICQIARSHKTENGFTDEVIAEGKATCSMSDIFNYGESRLLAFKRAIISHLKQIGMKEVIYTFASACDRWPMFWLVREAFLDFEKLRQKDEQAARKFDFNHWMTEKPDTAFASDVNATVFITDNSNGPQHPNPASI